MSTAALEWSRACTGKQARQRENRTPGARGSLTPGSNKTANGNASPARAHLFSRTHISEDLAPLDSEGHGVASAEAEGGDAALEIAALQFVEQGDEDARAAGADGMAEGDSAAVHVYFFGIELELPRNGNGSDGESFIEFDKVDVFVAVPAGLREQFLHGLHWRHHDPLRFD